jgi:AraC-like DNA-binding protein
MPEGAHADTGHSPPAGIPILRLSTEPLPTRDRAAIFCDIYARQMLRVDADPLREHPFHVDLTIRRLPGLDVVTSRNSPLSVYRTKEMLSDGNDSIMLQIGEDPIVVAQRGREMALAQGEATAFSNAEPASVAIPGSGGFRSLIVPRQPFAPLLSEPDDCLMRHVSRRTPALRLLLCYLELLKDDSTMTPELQRLAVVHVYDLLALALGANRDAAEIAIGRGVRAARLHAIKKDIGTSLDRALSIDAVAQRSRLTPRYIQKLFEGDRTTFTAFVREQRLDCAHRMLVNRRFGGKRIADVAMESGFNNLSYFNRMFRRRFGSSPSDVRARSMEGSD